MLAKSDLDHIVRIGNLSQECVAEAQFGEIMTGELVSLFNSGSAVFLTLDYLPDNTTLSACTSYGIDNTHGLRYQDYYHRSDPCYQELCQLIESRPQASVSTNQVIESEHAYVNSEYYQDFLRHTGVHKSLIFTLASNHRPVGLVGLHREKRNKDYSEADHLKVRLVAPYLSTAVMFRQKDRLLHQQNLFKHSILKSSNVDGYLLFNGQLICVDGGGAEALQLNTLAGDRQVVGMHCEQLLPPELVAMVRKQLRSEAVSDHQLSEQFDNLVNASHIRVEIIREDNGASYALFMFLKNDIELVCEQRMDYFGLTRRQKEIVRRVQSGFTNPQISAALNISAKTVENHLTQIYAKTYTHNKTSLLRQLHV